MGHTRSLYFTRLGRIAQTAGRTGLRCFRYFRGIARQMVGDLKTKEFVHGVKGLCAFCGNADARPALRILQLVSNRLAKTLHLLGARRVLRMNEHRRGKVSRRKQRYDMSEMRANRVTARGVLRVLGFHFDGAAVAIACGLSCGSSCCIPAKKQSANTAAALGAFVMLKALSL